MEDIARQKICDIISKYGLSLCEDPQRCEALLRDYCSVNRKEIHALICALKDGVVSELANSQSGLPIPVLIAQYEKRLHEHFGLSEDAAHWAVESWMIALNLLSPDEATTIKPTQSYLPSKTKNRNRWFWVTIGLLLIIVVFTTWELGIEWGKEDIQPKPDRRMDIAPPPSKTYPAQPATYGTLVVNSDPGGANVLMEGKKIGETPFTLDKIEKGSKRIEIVKEGYERKEETVEITSPGTVKLQITLMSVYGELYVASEPTGAELYVDEAYIGNTSMRIAKVHKGERKIEVKKDGYLPWTKWVWVEALGSSEVTAKLERTEPEKPKQQGKPVELVLSYYEDLDRHDSDSAIKKWSPPRSFLRSKINRIEWFKVNEIQEKRSTLGTAEVWVNVTGKNTEEKSQNWVGTVDLVKSGGEWKISKMNLRPQ